MSRNSTRPEISVILPVHNVEGYVGRCIASLRAQTFTDFEVIVVDDGSTDGSLSETWQAIGTDARFRIVSQPNAGLSAARNTGLEHARGKFVGFVDSDDRVAPDFLASLRGAIVATGADWAACALRYCNANGTTFDHPAIHGLHATEPEPRPVLHSFDTWNEVIRHFPSAWNKLYRAKLIDGLRFANGLWFEDHPFFHELASRTSAIAHVNLPLYLQTQGRAGQITGMDSSRVFEQFDVLERVEAIMERSNRPGAREALERLATRLSFERSCQLRDPNRRKAFAQASGRFLSSRGLRYAPEWDDEISRAWGLTVSGRLPLSIVVQDTGNTEALNATLASLAAQNFADFELFLEQRGNGLPARRRLKRAVEQFPQAPVLTARTFGPARTLKQVQRRCSGEFLLFLSAGDALAAPDRLAKRLEGLIRANAGWSATNHGSGPVSDGLFRATTVSGLPDAPLSDFAAIVAHLSHATAVVEFQQPLTEIGVDAP